MADYISRYTGAEIDAAIASAAGRERLTWADLNALASADQAKVLEAAQLVLTSEVQAVFDSLQDTSATLTVDGAEYTVRGLGNVADSLMYKGGALWICRKINNAGDALRGEYAFTAVACEDLAAVIDSAILPCTVEQLLAGNVKSISYAACGAYLDGVHDDFEAMYRAHYIGDLCSCVVEQHGGTIYKANSGWLYINNHNVDLSGSALKIDAYNRYGTYWLGGQTYHTTPGLVLSEVVQYATVWPSAETGYRANGLFIVTRPNDTTRWNDGVVTSEDRKEIVRHGMDGRVYSPVIDDAKEDTEVTFVRYPETQLTFRGCTLDIDIAFASVVVYFIRCERSNVVIRDFVVNPTRRTTQNIGYRGALFTLNNCADITMENVKGVNIAGRPTTSYPRGVAGYILSAVCILDLTVRDCNLLGYWGCVGLNGAKEITFTGCELNRVDIHDYFANLTIDNCRIYGQTINIGYGKGAVNVSNSQVLTDWVHQIINLRCDYGRYFEGEININNVDAVYTGADHFDIVSGITMYSAESAAGSGLFMQRYPTINVSNVTMRLMGDSYAGYVFDMPASLEAEIAIADKRKVVTYANVTVFDKSGNVLQLAACPLGGVVNNITQTICAPAIVSTVTGAEIAVSDAAKACAVGVKTYITAMQAGEGNASPDNVRPVSGWNAVNITNDTTAQTLTAEMPETVYGGVLDWTTGVLTVDKMAVVYDGTEDWIKNNTVSNTVRRKPPEGALTVALCTHYRARSVTPAGNDMSVSIGQYINFRDSSRATDVETWIAYLTEQAAAGTPVTTVYTLAETRTIQLDPRLLDMCKGANVIRSDCGETYLDYIADTKLYIDQRIAALITADQAAE